MPHTQSRYMADLGFPDGRVLATPNDVIVAGTTVLTRNAAGDWSWNQAASLTVNYAVNLTSILLRRSGFGEDLQEQFGGAGIAASAQPQIYRPDVIPAMGALQQITPRTALKVKGVKLLSFSTTYLITGAALTTHTCRVDQTIHSNNVANAITVVLATGANGLATATQANPYVTSIAISAAEQTYRISTNQAIWLDFTVTTQAAGTYRLYGVDFVCEFNWN